MPLAPLPIDDALPDLLSALRVSPSAVLRAPTGAGKTTRVPPALLDAGLAGQGQIVVLEPRRLAARAAARRMAFERGGDVGGEIGYQVRFDHRLGPRTRVLVLTPGMLVRHFLDDPYLERVSIVVCDEFHERGLESDLCLGLARLLQQTVRPELRIIVMSATLDTATVSAYLGGCPVVTSEGRQFPVEVLYEPRPAHRPLAQAVVGAVERVLDRTPGDVLVFLPGMNEIRQAARLLEPLAFERGLAVLPLHGDLPPEQQDAALLPAPARKVVLATNVAETSVTVDGVTAVVDTGLARVLAFDPAVGLDRLGVVAISRASAEQRSGRAGRTSPGVCVRLWSQSLHLGRPEQTAPEVKRVDLASAVLQLLALGENDPLSFAWFEPPAAAGVASALRLLELLGATSGTELTDLGKTLARLPIHPRLGRLLLEGWRLGQAKRAALAAAILSERDPFASAGRQDHSHVTDSDVLDRVEALERFELANQTSFDLGTLSRGSARNLLRARDQLSRAVRQEMTAADAAPGPTRDADEPLLRALLAAYPDRLARRRQPGSHRGVMVGGRGVRLASSSGVTASELFLCIDVDAGHSEAIVRLASAVERDWLAADRISTKVEVAFDPDAERVVGQRRIRYEDLVLQQEPAVLTDSHEVSGILAEAARSRLDRVLPPAESPAMVFRTRVRCLGPWMPELGLPMFDDAEIAALVADLCRGKRSFAELRQGPWLESFQGRLTYQQRQAVEREAPEKFTVPSGSRIALRYEEGRPPVLAVRIQELFGLEETPRVAAGRVRVLLHLLGPNYRPQQVTDDLPSFWDNTYPQVRKDLRARYPRHAWPEDPRTAIAEHRPRRK